MLEKRVRSRCQSQVIQMALENKFENFLETARSMLRVDEIVWKKKGKLEGRLASEWNAKVEVSRFRFVL